MNTNNAPFRVGQRVVFLGYGDGTCFAGKTLQKGTIYTVAGVDYSKSYIHSDEKDWYVLLDGQKNVGTLASRFAPIEENRIRYVAVSETLREKAQEVVIETLTTS